MILGVDFGARRIGVAVSDPLGIAAIGLDTIQADGTGSELDCVAQVAKERGAELIVVGMPLNMDGSEGPQARKVRGFVKRLKSRVRPVPVVTEDERLTTDQAHDALSLQKASPDQRAESVDRMAAQLIRTKGCIFRGLA